MSLGVDFEITQVGDSNIGLHSVIPKWVLKLCSDAVSDQYLCNLANDIFIVSWWVAQSKSVMQILCSMSFSQNHLCLPCCILMLVYSWRYNSAARCLSSIYAAWLASWIFHCAHTTSAAGILGPAGGFLTRHDGKSNRTTQPRSFLGHLGVATPSALLRFQSIPYECIILCCRALEGPQCCWTHSIKCQWSLLKQQLVMSHLYCYRLAHPNGWRQDDTHKFYAKQRLHSMLSKPRKLLCRWTFFIPCSCSGNDQPPTPWLARIKKKTIASGVSLLCTQVLPTHWHRHASILSYNNC